MAWSVGRTEREWADGPFLTSGCIVVWRAEHSMRERAVGLFSYSDQISVVNSNLSQFIFYLEII
jgi:hypothetical protein